MDIVTVKKAVILAAGAGKRLDPITATRPKHLIPIAGKPILQYTIEYLKTIGISDILLVVGYKKEQIQEYFQDGGDFGVSISYIEQKQYLGTSHATKLAKSFVSDDTFLLLYGDLLMDSQVFQQIQHLAKSEENIILCKEVTDPDNFGVVVCDKNQYVQKIVEKPADDTYGNLVNAGVYLFSPKIFDAIKNTKKSERKEYELTDTIEIFLEMGQKLRVLNISANFWNDVGRPWDILTANQYFLDKLSTEIKGTVEEGVHIKGVVIVGNNTVIKSGTYIEGPVLIGENCTIGPNAYIRPYTSLGNKVKIGNSSEIKNTVVFSHTHISHLSYVGDSIIGENVNLDNSNINLNSYD